MNRVVIGDCREVLRTFDEASVQCVVTSPPYWGLRDYGHAGQLGLEPTPEEYVQNLVAVFREVWRVLKPDGVAWLNLGDCYITKPHGKGRDADPKWPEGRPRAVENFANRAYAGGETRGSNRPAQNGRGEPQVEGHVPPRGGPPRKPRTPSEASSNLTNPERQERVIQHERPNDKPPAGLKHKDKVLMPARVALALQADGWWVRQEIIWSKPSCMPESVTDRPTTSHEKVYLLSRAEEAELDHQQMYLLSRDEKYHYDAEAIAEAAVSTAPAGNKDDVGGTRNARSVWTLPAQPYKGAHFAVMPPKLVERCILAGSRVGDVVLDPFMGSGTVAMVAEQWGRRWLGVELNPEYEALILERTKQRGLGAAIG